MFATTFATWAVPLDPIFTADSPWKLSQSGVAERLPQVRISSVESGKRLVANRQELTLFGKPVLEWRANLRDGLLCRMDVSFYNKGDNTKEVLEEDFFDQVKQCIAAIERATKAPSRKPVLKPAGTQRRYEVWEQEFRTDKGLLVLSWAFSRQKRRRGIQEPFRAEYINASYIPANEKPSAIFEAKVPGELALRNRVKREPSQDVWIDTIPMVDQGQKGYCAVSTAERIFGYYNLSVDQHFFAMLAETERGGGTSFGGISRALESAGRKYQFDVVELVTPLRSHKDFSRTEMGKTFAAYNRVAPREDRLKLDSFKTVTANSSSLDIQSIYEAYKPEILRKARTVGQAGAYNKFKNDVKHYINAGIPLMWSCFVGIYPEVPSLNVSGGGIGGHIRLIVGYNAKTDEILYSDTWGRGHEKKRMTSATAWAMTTGLCVVKPRSIR